MVPPTIAIALIELSTCHLIQYGLRPGNPTKLQIVVNTDIKVELLKLVHVYSTQVYP
jgi:hypothetical protein